MKKNNFKKSSIVVMLSMFLVSGLISPMKTTAFASPATVNLLSAANFTIILKTAISTTGATTISGDLGISPAAATFVTGFGLVMDASNTFSTSSLVTGNIYAADYAAPTPSYVGTAVVDM